MPSTTTAVEKSPWRGIRAKLVLVLLIPTVASLVLAGLRLENSWSQAQQATRAQTLSRTLPDTYTLALLLQQERDAYGVGTQLVTGSGHPTSGFVYKLVAHQDDGGAWLDVAKKSKDKVSIGGRKHAARRVVDGTAEAELIVVADPGTEPAWQPGERPVLVPLVTDGEIVAGEPLDVSRERHRERLAELPLRGHRLSKGDPVLPVEFR